MGMFIRSIGFYTQFSCGGIILGQAETQTKEDEKVQRHLA